ncbi:temptin-like [Haliotis rubra]|uniref:temptin-like n=1 Tax=Haliotis rubra TaxID=36100 RepID=UPI001EE5DA3D|nr:temptin-like [Haliotis rubra]
MLPYLCLLMISVAMAMEQDQANIPHGYLVPNPCYPTVHWSAVGHTHHFTGSQTDLNQFGKDFKEAGLKWTPELCFKDSDGDGWTNGHELGDSRCVWMRGQPEEEPVRSHPGINEHTHVCT